MGTREYQGAGGLRLHLDDPLSPEMEKQVARGHLVPVDAPTGAEESPDGPAADEMSTTSEATASGKPSANAKVDDWRAYAVTLGMSEEDAASATKKDCQEYAQVVEDAAEGQE
ncbi:hypothetical protein [Streptomyces sp. SM13]|uniref:hypothetical protein n=1 Tax=Streptomyces sp. SM13 TaxID=1983803 RepID=UPI000CD55892|nr:hypothetical protein [Streptomyces sp. SM13]